MITLASDCLVFEMASGEGIPFSAEMISVELTGEGAGKFDPHFVQHAAKAVFHYFKHDLGRLTVTVGEFAGVLEKVLRNFGFCAQALEDAVPRPPMLESDLSQLAGESGAGCELLFFPRLRDEMRLRLQEAPRVLRFRGLRGCVKQLAGVRRWSARCQALHDQIVEFLRDCFQAEAGRSGCALLVE